MKVIVPEVFVLAAKLWIAGLDPAVITPCTDTFTKHTFLQVSPELLSVIVSYTTYDPPSTIDVIVVVNPEEDDRAEEDPVGLMRVKA